MLRRIAKIIDASRLMPFKLLSIVVCTVKMNFFFVWNLSVEFLDKEAAMQRRRKTGLLGGGGGVGQFFAKT